MKTITIYSIIITLLVIILFFLIIADKIDEHIQKEKSRSYILGHDEGIRFWNMKVIDAVNKEGKIPYIINDSAQFSKLFKKRFGVSPSHYKLSQTDKYSS